MKLIRYDVTFPVKVRKYDVDIIKLQQLLRESKKSAKLSNRQIATSLNRPRTEVEHWFRTDNCFSIPDANLWYELKVLLGINDNSFDSQVTEFVTKPGEYDMSNRVYDVDGLSPTITTSSIPKILVKKGMKSNYKKRGNSLECTKNYTNKLKVVELFSGIGAWAKALENLNIPHEVVLAVEHDEYPLTGYNAIHNSNFETTDITKLNENDVPDCDIICYSPPCQSFSAAGKQLGFEDQRGILFFDALRIIKAKKPKYALMENVKGLTQKKFANEFSVMLDELEKAGYRNYWKVINAKDYGIPQNRERVFVVSIRSDIEQEFSFPQLQELTNSLSDYLEDDAELPILHNIYGGFKEDKARVFDEYSPTIRTSAGGGHIPSVMVKGCSLRTRSYMNQPQKLEIRKDGVSNTVTTVPKDYMVALVDDTYKGKEVKEYAPTLKSGRKGFKVVHKDSDSYKLVKDASGIVDDSDYFFIREMTTLEAFRLMGFDDEDYEKARFALNEKYYKGKDKSNTRLYKMSGNSIVVNVCEELFKSLLK